MQTFKIAAIQTRPVCRRVSKNLIRAGGLIRRAAATGARIILLPELFDTGYDLPWIKRNACRTAPDTLRELAQLASEFGVYIVAGIAEERGRYLYNTSFVLSPSGRIAGRYDKNFLFRAYPQREDKYFKEGKGAKVVDTEYGKIGLAICNDLRYPQLFSGQAGEGARIIFVSSAWSMKRLEHWKVFLRARALENQIYIAAANQAGRAGRVALAGCSMIVDFDGRVLSKIKGVEGIVTAVIDYKKLARSRKGLPTFYNIKNLVPRQFYFYRLSRYKCL